MLIFGVEGKYEVRKKETWRGVGTVGPENGRHADVCDGT